MKRVLTGAAFLAVIGATGVQAETTECTVITSVPTVITTQGVHCLKGNLGTNIATGYAIEIATNNVTIDMNGYKLGGLAAGPASAAGGIGATDRKNITIRNGNIRGFAFGIALEETAPGGSAGHVIEDMLVDFSILTGIYVAGSANVVKRNRIVGTVHMDTASAPAVPLPGRIGQSGVEPADHGDTINAGILALTRDSQIIGNVISNVSTDQFGSAGIMLATAETTEVRGNKISGLEGAEGTAGIYVDTGSDILIADNVVADGGSPLETVGITADLSSGVICAFNKISGFNNDVNNCDTEVANLVAP